MVFLRRLGGSPRSETLRRLLFPNSRFSAKMPKVLSEKNLTTTV